MENKNVYKNIHQEIINRCKEGDQKAQFELYKLYYKAMYNTCLRIVKNTAEAEDIMQESFLKAFDKIETYSGTVSFGAWLKKIVVNNAIDVIKSKKLNLDSFENMNTEPVESFDNTSNYDYTALKADQIKNAINELPEGYRLVLSLYLIEGYDHDEIGQIMGITSSTSRSQYTRAKRKLQESLKQKSITIWKN